MRTKAIALASAAALMAGWMGAAQAGTVTLTPDNATIQVGQTVTFTYTMDFQNDPTFGGGTDFWYDSNVLEFVGWTFNPNLNSDDTSLRSAPVDCLTNPNATNGCNDADFAGAQLNGMGWGNGNGNGMTGPETIGELVFLAVGPSVGATTVFMSVNDDGNVGDPGPFVAAPGGTTLNDVMFNHGSVTVVPVPAAVWMLLSGLGALGGLRRFV